MQLVLNTMAVENAKALIRKGEVDKDSEFTFDAADEDRILGDDDWDEYGKWFLATDKDYPNKQTKEHWHHAIGKDGKIFRRALLMIRRSLGQQKIAQEVYDAAGELIDLIDESNDGDDKVGSHFDVRRARVAAMPWALMPECLAIIANPFVSDITARPANVTPGPSGGIAVIPLNGVITQHPDWLGDTSVDEFYTAFAAAITDPSVGAVLVSIDSPGGSVYGIQELSQAMIAARELKPIVAIANSLAASAAYWIGCSASEFYCTPSGEVGSIGVWQAHMDFSGALEKAGIKTTLISAGKYKVEGNPFQPLDKDALSFLQSRVDDYYNAFAGAVAAARGVAVSVVKNGMGEGRVLGAQEAVKQNMIDGVMTMPQVISLMQSKLSQTSKPKARSLERMSLQLLG